MFQPLCSKLCSLFTLYQIFFLYFLYGILGPTAQNRCDLYLKQQNDQIIQLKLSIQRFLDCFHILEKKIQLLLKA